MHPEGRLLGEPKAAKALLEFVARWPCHMAIFSRLKGMPEGVMNGAYMPWKRPNRPAYANREGSLGTLRQYSHC
jgi:hypothetical protein